MKLTGSYQINLEKQKVWDALNDPKVLKQALPGCEEFKKNSKIESEKKTNPRLQVSSTEEFAEMMNNLNLTIPKMINIAVPANIKGLTLDQLN